MGMGYGANYGWCSELTPELMIKMGISQEEQESDDLEEIIGTANPDNPIYEKIENFLGTNRFWLYRHADGDRYDELEEDTLYIIFDQGFLFDQVKSIGFHQVTSALGIEPQHKLWVTFG